MCGGALLVFAVMSWTRCVPVRVRLPMQRGEPEACAFGQLHALQQRLLTNRRIAGNDPSCKRKCLCASPVSLQIALKVADIGHLAGELGVHKRWVDGRKWYVHIRSSRHRVCLQRRRPVHSGA